MAELPDKDALRALAANVFLTSSTGHKDQAHESILGGMHRSILGYRLPSNASNDDRLLAMGCLTLCGTATNGDSPDWETFVLTFTALAFPELIGPITRGGAPEYLFEDFPDTFLASIRAAEVSVTENPESEPRVVIPGGLPNPTINYTVATYNCSTLKAVYAYYALIVHLMGKKITPSTRENMTVRRPQNLIDAFDISQEAFILTGGGKMSSNAHVAINRAWDGLDAARHVAIPELARLRSVTTRPARIVFTMFMLLRYSGMQPAALIHQLISVYPWVGEIPILRPEFDRYRRNVIEYANMDEVERPFVKIKYGNASDIFHAKSLAGLTSIAVMVLTAQNPTLQGYTAPGGETAKRAFLEELTKRGLALPGAQAQQHGIAPPAQ